MTSLMVAAGRRTGSELVWLASAVVRLVRFVPGAVLIWLGLGMVGTVVVGETFLLLWVLVPVVLGLVGRWWPDWLDTHIAEPVRRRRIRHRVIGSWDGVRTGAGLPDAMILRARPRWRGSELVLSPVLPPGTTLEDVEKVADRLAAGLGAVRVRVTAPGPGRIEILARFADPLATASSSPLPSNRTLLATHQLGASTKTVTSDRVEIGTERRFSTSGQHQFEKRTTNPRNGQHIREMHNTQDNTGRFLTQTGFSTPAAAGDRTHGPLLTIPTRD